MHLPESYRPPLDHARASAASALHIDAQYGVHGDAGTGSERGAVWELLWSRISIRRRGSLGVFWVVVWGLFGGGSTFTHR